MQNNVPPLETTPILARKQAEHCAVKYIFNVKLQVGRKGDGPLRISKNKSLTALEDYERMMDLLGRGRTSCCAVFAWHFKHVRQKSQKVMVSSLGLIGLEPQSEDHDVHALLEICRRRNNKIMLSSLCFINHEAEAESRVSQSSLDKSWSRNKGSGFQVLAWSGLLNRVAPSRK